MSVPLDRLINMANIDLSTTIMLMSEERIDTYALAMTILLTRVQNLSLKNMGKKEKEMIRNIYTRGSVFSRNKILFGQLLSNRNN